MESFLLSLKAERIGNKVYRTRAQATADVLTLLNAATSDAPPLDLWLSQPRRFRTGSWCGLIKPALVSAKPAASHSLKFNRYFVSCDFLAHSGARLLRQPALPSS